MKRNEKINKVVRQLCAGGNEVLDTLQFVVLARNNMIRNNAPRSEISFANALEDKLVKAADAMREHVTAWREESGLSWADFMEKYKDC